MTTKTEHTKSPLHLALPLLAGYSMAALTKFAKNNLPDLPTSGGVNKAGMVDLFANIMSSYLHEHGHRAVMLHLNPESETEITMDVRPVFADEGVGVSIAGAQCGSDVEYADVHERMMVSIAGWISENLCVDLFAGDTSPFDVLTGHTLMFLFTSPEFEAAFPGGKGDFDHIKHCVSQILGKKKAFEEMDDIEQSRKMREVKDRMSAAFDAALRVVKTQRESIVEQALSDTIRLFTHTVHRLNVLGEIHDSIRFAGLGLYSEADKERALHRKERIKSAWNGETE